MVQFTSDCSRDQNRPQNFGTCWLSFYFPRMSALAPRTTARTESQFPKFINSRGRAVLPIAAVCPLPLPSPVTDQYMQARVSDTPDSSTEALIVQNVKGYEAPRVQIPYLRAPSPQLPDILFSKLPASMFMEHIFDTYIYIHTHMYVYIYIYIYVCVCAQAKPCSRP